MQNSDGGVEAVALKPGVRERLRVCGARARDPYTQKGLLLCNESFARETLLFRYREPDLVLDEIVGDAVPGGRPCVGLNSYIGYVPLGNGPPVNRWLPTRVLRQPKTRKRRPAKTLSFPDSA
jgi:hypothetical protein